MTGEGPRASGSPGDWQSPPIEATPSLRLFLSADLTGSTALKQKQAAHEWQLFFNRFYTQLPVYVERQFGSEQNRLSVWKTIGDEIVFSAALVRSADVPTMVRAFRDGVAEYRRDMLAGFPALDIKTAGWTAGFPVGNLAVPLAGQPPQTDYIGPAMDIGFRLVKEATPRRFMLSVELAFILTRVDPDSCIRVDKSLDLKGVGRGHRYPALWLDHFHTESEHCSVWDRLELAEERLTGPAPARLPCEDVNAYCRDWLAAIGEPFMIPFIDGDPVLGERPASYLSWLERLTTKTQEPHPMSPTEETEAAEGDDPRDLDVFTPIVRQPEPPSPG